MTVDRRQSVRDAAVANRFRVIIGALLLVGISTAHANEQRRPNFVVLLCDNLGYGDIEPFGSTVHRTPNLSRMAERGRLMTHFYVSAGVCTPSRASLMTGCYAQRIGLHSNPRDGWVLRPLSPYGLHPDEMTIAERLKTAGYQTALIGKWHLGDQPPFLPTEQGFDLFFGVPYSDDMTQSVGRRIAPRYDGGDWPPLPLMRQTRVIESPPDRNLLTKRYTEAAVDFVTRCGDEPFFLLLSHAMPGSTKTPFASDAFRGRSRNGPWGDSVEELDWSTGRIIETLKVLGLEDDTLVIFTSDNGAPSNPDGIDRGTNKPLFGRGYSTAEGAFRVPTIAFWPEHIPEGTVCAELATMMDLLPTFAALAGTTAPSDRVIDGLDISSLLLGDSSVTSPHEHFFYYQTDQLQAVRSGRFKFFLPLAEFDKHPHFRRGKPGKPLLFDVVSDIACETNLAAEHPDVVARLSRVAAKQAALFGTAANPGPAVRPRGQVAEVSPRIPDEG